MKRVKITRKSFLSKMLILSSSPFLFSFRLPYGSFEQKGSLFDISGNALADKDLIAEKLKNRNDPMIWVFTGDSITHGAKHTHGYRSYPEVFAERIRWEISRVRDVIINTGISGNTTRVILNEFDWRVRQFRPDVVSLMIGTNDCAIGRIEIMDFEKNLHNLVVEIRNSSAIPIFHTPNIIITEKAPERSRLSDYVSVIRNVAMEEKIILVDNYSYWQKTHQDGTVNVYREWLNDPLHPDGEGHSEIARLMFKELSIFDPEASSCGGPYYEGEH